METFTLKSLNEWVYSSNLNLYSGLILTKIPFDLIQSLDFAQCKQPTQSASEYYSLHDEDTQPALIVNGGLFYLKDGTPVLTLIDEGKLINEEDWLTTGFGIQNQKDINFVDLKDKDIKNNIRDFCSAYPILVKDGKKVPITYATELKGKNTRTIIGWNTNKTYLCILTFTEKYTFEECQDIILDLGITFAGALDGGTSTQLMIDGVNVYHANGSLESGSRDVDNVFCVYLPNEYPVYKVNLGSFGVKSNCQKLLNEIHTLKTNVHDYSDAYMIYDETNGKWYYKCRVGYFTVKENAERLVKDLKEHGYNAFIVVDKASRKRLSDALTF